MLSRTEGCSRCQHVQLTDQDHYRAQQGCLESLVSLHLLNGGLLLVEGCPCLNVCPQCLHSNCMLLLRFAHFVLTGVFGCKKVATDL